MVGDQVNDNLNEGFLSPGSLGVEHQAPFDVFWKPGDILGGNWEIRDIKYGGMGTLYVVFDRHVKQQMIAKTCRAAYHDEVGTSDALDLFKRECSIWLSLDMHPNIVQVLMVHEILGWPFLFLECVVGDTLRSQIANYGQYSLPQVCLWGIHICDGMSHALAKGLKSHNDLRPENCLIDSQSNVLKISDFGLSTTQYETGITKSGGGSPRYMAPERFISSGGIWSDIYSLGVILFELANQEPPFRAKSTEAYAKIHAEAKIPPLSREYRELQTLVHTCLQKNPSDRFQSFSAVRAELTKIYSQITGISVHLPPIDVSDYVPSSCREGEIVSINLPPSLEEGHYYSLPAVHFANKAVSLRRLGLQKLALEACDNALKFDPDLVEVLLNKGVILQALHRYQEAIDCFNMILHFEGPSYARIRRAALYNKANAKRSLGLNQEALRCLAEVIKEEPSAAAFQTKGDILLELGSWQEAGEAFEEAIQLDPSSFHAWTQIGFVLSEYAQLYEEGNRCYDCALVLDPTAFQWRVHKGINLFRLGRFQDAVECFDVVLSMNREFVNAWYEKGLALCELNENAAALGCFEETLRLDPDFDHAWEYKGLLLLQEHKFDAALVCLQRAAALGVKGLERSMKLCEDSLECRKRQ